MTTKRANSVESIVGKAKLAGEKLWLMIHSQSCTVGVGGNRRCPHAGCNQAKLLNLHIKVCPTKGTDRDCPLGYQGCTQARKLLLHHKKCSNARRFKQAIAKQQRLQQQQKQEEEEKQKHPQSSSSSLSSMLMPSMTTPTMMPSTESSCLICSMVSRKAKSVLLNAPAVQQRITKSVLLTRTTQEKAKTKERTLQCISNALSMAADVTFAEGEVPMATNNNRESNGIAGQRKTNNDSCCHEMMPPPAPRT